MSRSFVFVHGSGRAGAANWPNQLDAFPHAAFLTMPGYGDEHPRATDMGDWVDRVLGVTGELDIVAHSYGGLAAILAVARAPERIRSLTLFEPAAYFFARGDPSIEAMIARMTPVIDQATVMDAADYEVSFIAALTGSPPPRPETPAELIAAERDRLLAAPWSFELPIGVLSAVPTRVVTGDWNAEYETIAQRMVDAGARHAHLLGFGHRVQDHPGANATILDAVIPEL